MCAPLCPVVVKRWPYGEDAGAQTCRLQCIHTCVKPAEGMMGTGWGGKLVGVSSGSLPWTLQIRRAACSLYSLSGPLLTPAEGHVLSPLITCPHIVLFVSHPFFLSSVFSFPCHQPFRQTPTYLLFLHLMLLAQGCFLDSIYAHVVSSFCNKL